MAAVAASLVQEEASEGQEEQLDTSTTDDMYSGQPFAILRCFFL